MINFFICDQISPNLERTEDLEAEMYWLQFSDFYEWSHIQLFDDFHHLKRLILDADFQTIHENMKAENILRTNQATRKWCNIIKRIERHKQISKQL